MEWRVLRSRGANEGMLFQGPTGCCPHACCLVRAPSTRIPAPAGCFCLLTTTTLGAPPASPMRALDRTRMIPIACVSRNESWSEANRVCFIVGDNLRTVWKGVGTRTPKNSLHCVSKDGGVDARKGASCLEIGVLIGFLIEDVVVTKLIVGSTILGKLRDVQPASELWRVAVMVTTLRASHGQSFWMHNNLLEQHSLVSERILHSEVATSLGPNGSALGLHTEILPSTAPSHTTSSLMATQAEFRGRDAGEEHGHLLPARKLQKAGRERLRRDHLNEQLAKLASVVDPVRPKLDKGTILAESILAILEVRADITRMKNEQIALSDESRDLNQEKAELQEEKTLLESEIGRLQDLVGQRNQSAGDNPSAVTGSWIMDQPGGPMTIPQFPYPSMTKFPLPSKDDPSDPNSPFSTFLHPAYQAYGMSGSRQWPGYTHFPNPGEHIHVVRPAARYPAPIHPTPVYPVAVSESGQAKASKVGTTLHLQTPGFPPSSIIQHSVSEHERPED